MCGIAGIFDRRGREPPDPRTLQRMAALLAHRGPDDAGHYADEHAGLAHARLAVIDLASGRQPVHDESRALWVVLNGEIFNYVELRQELLARGHRFYTQSDTEVLVHLYEERGEQLVEQLNGQFAFALWDTRQRRLLLARDRVGICPLFFTEVGERLLFASEVKALFAAPDVERALDPQGLAQLFTYWAPIAPRTVFRGVRALPPGHTLLVDEHGARQRRYWDWRFPAAAAAAAEPRIAEHAEELRALLVDAVRLRLRADVPVGAYLSGGLDSSALTALIRNYTAAPLRSFSLVFEDAEFDERGHQQTLVEHLGSEHSATCCTARAICAAFPRTIWHTESPVLRTAPTPLLLLSALVREQGYKVVLTGEGADEVFAGYDIFREASLRRLWIADPEGTEAAGLLDRLYPYLKASPLASPAYARRFFSQGQEHVDEPFFGHVPRWATTSRAFRFFSADLSAALADFDRYAAIRALLPAEIGTWAPLCRDQYIEAHTLLDGYLLASQGDRMIMANSVEGRYPYLDHRVIELGNRLPPAAKLHHFDEKHVLKRAVADLLPEPILRRSKQPYRAPDSPSFFRDGRPAAEYVAELLSPARLGERGYFAPAPTTKLLQKCAAGRAIGFADNMAFVGVLSTMLLDDLFIRPAKITPQLAPPAPDLHAAAAAAREG